MAYLDVEGVYFTWIKESRFCGLLLRAIIIYFSS